MAESNLRRVSPGEIIFRNGDAGDYAYFIESGRVLVYLGSEGSEVPVKILEAGEVFGETALVDGAQRVVSCRAVTETRLIFVTRKELSARIKADDPIARLFMQVLIRGERNQHEQHSGKSSSIELTVESLNNEKNEAAKRIDLEIRIANAIETNEFVPFYQPIFDLSTGEIKGCEALLRWITKGRGIVSPGEFMDVLEDSPLILRVGRFVIERAMEDFKVLSKCADKPEDFFVSINVSGRQFMDPTFIEHLEQTRERCGLSPAQVKLELTERVMTECLPAMSTLYHCQGLGYRLAIDDFGTGFSSLQYLARMPLTDLKIDRSFVMTMLSDSRNLSIVKSLIGMATNLGLNLTAEGIEVTEELLALRDMNVGMGQGFLFSKAVSVAEFVKLPRRLQAVKPRQAA